MAEFIIRTYPDSALRFKCKTILKDSIDAAKIQKTFDEMLMTMYSNKGIGLASSQVGINEQVMVVDIGDGPLKFMNPVIIKKEGDAVMEEGCLSLPGVAVSVKRAKKVVLKALNEKLIPITIEAEGLLARVIQHEVDHLCGVLIIDYMNPIKKVVTACRLCASKKPTA